MGQKISVRRRCAWGWAALILLAALCLPVAAQTASKRGAPEAAADAMLDRAEALYAQKQYPNAIPVYQEIFNKYPQWNYAAHALMMIGVCQDAMGQKDKAIESLKFEIEKYPAVRGFSDTGYMMLVAAYQSAGKNDEAREVAGRYRTLVAQGALAPPDFNNRMYQNTIGKLDAAATAQPAPNPTPAATRAPARQPADPSGPPKIVSMEPANGAADVDPAAVKELKVEFDMPMGGGFSWTGGGPNFPQIPEGQRPRWSDDRMTCYLPVLLKSGWQYRLGLNSKSHKNFRSQAGVPLTPVLYQFSTSGTPPPAPQIVSMEPANGAADVDAAAVKELKVEFDVPMGGGFSWCGGGDHYPTVPQGQRPRWSDDRKTCYLPVQLKPGWSYQLGLNSPSFQNFRSADGIPLSPVLYEFRTK
ncbi:MAG: tetratricopeptide repeat protein [Candidatus Sumerlaeia bacterium]